jgi:hypothetical protein
MAEARSGTRSLARLQTESEPCVLLGHQAQALQAAPVRPMLAAGGVAMEIGDQVAQTPQSARQRIWWRPWAR